MALEVKQVIGQTHKSGQVTCCEYNKRRGEVYTGSTSGDVKAWEEATGRHVRTLHAHTGWVTAIHNALLNRVVITAGLDAKVRVWTELGKRVMELKLDNPLFCVAHDPERRLFIGGAKSACEFLSLSRSLMGTDYDRSLRGEVNDDETKRRALTRVASPSSQAGIIRSIVASPDGRVFCGGDSGGICCYDAERPGAGMVVSLDKCHDGAIRVLSYDDRNDRVVSCGHDGKIRLWSPNLRLLELMVSSVEPIAALSHCKATNHYWFAAKRHKVRAFDPGTPSELTSQIDRPSSLSQYSISHLHQPVNAPEVLMGMTTKKSLVLWKYNPSSCFRSLHAHFGWVDCMCVARRQLEDYEPSFYTGGGDGFVRRWVPNSELNTETYHCQNAVRAHSGVVLSAAYNAELDLLATGGEDGIVAVWNLEHLTDPIKMEERQGTFLEGHHGKVACLACLPECVLASGSSDKSIRFWDLHTLHCLEQIENAHTAPLHTFSLADEVEELASCASEPVVHIWDAFYRWHKRTLVGHTSDVNDVTYSVFLGKWLTASDDESVGIFSADGEAEAFFPLRGRKITRLIEVPRSSILLAASVDLSIRAYDLTDESFRQLDRHSGHTDIISLIAVVPELKHYISASWDNTICVWAAPEHPARQLPPGPNIPACITGRPLTSDERFQGRRSRSSESTNVRYSSAGARESQPGNRRASRGGGALNETERLLNKIDVQQSSPSQQGSAHDARPSAGGESGV